MRVSPGSQSRRSSLPDLEPQARQFAVEVGSLLNRTICDGIRVGAVLTPRGVIVGKGVGKQKFSAEAVPVTISRADPKCWLLVAHTFLLDDEGVYLTAAKSLYTLYLDEEQTQMVFHYDYDRSPANRYPQAHFQINGSSPNLEALAERNGFDRELLRYHFPVGGKRYRPTLEDVIEFMIVEGLADARPGWEDAIAEGRETWHAAQLLAAVRRDEPMVRQFLGLPRTPDN